jgi:uncharacterized iron-regulated membrane protein
MSLWQRWARQPQSIWLRKALFQIHLWTGIGVGLYVLVTSVSGSAVVFRNEILRTFTPQAIVEVSGPALNDDELKAAALRNYPDYRVTQILRPRRNRRNPDTVPIEKRPVEIWLERDESSLRRLFDPYTGADLKSATSPVIIAVGWIDDLHVNLLNGETGRVVNGLAGALFTLVAMTGLVIWWPGIKTWRRSLSVQWKSSWKRLNWDLHSAVGFWTFLFVAMWGVTGILVSFPVPFYDLANYLSPSENGVHEVADSIFQWSARIHFGTFVWPVKVLWVLIGLTPAFLFITGTLMWWNRVLKPAMEKSGKRSEVETGVETIGLMR